MDFWIIRINDEDFFNGNDWFLAAVVFTKKRSLIHVIS